MLSDERRKQIFDYIKRKASVTTKELENQFEVSGSTIRRDLNYLASKKLIIKTHKGAILNVPQAETSFYTNYNYMTLEKKEIAKKAMNFIRDGDFISLSGGTTCYFLAKEIVASNLAELTILTNSLNVALLIIDSNKYFQVIVSGGIPKKGSYECVGQITISAIRNFNIDKYFVGVNGISISGDISFTFMDEAAIAQEINKNAKETYVISDHSKFGKSNMVKFAKLDEVTGIITDSQIPEDVKRLYLEKGANII
ncbi:hypothetical protein X927_08965 [Petrotoga mexicana DSM 14811]|uniref:HTH deoR-type domain-containing protein n=2 Tax=Petrotoga TaxID=28236 RepID=A0A2K1P6J6_9BACT|nr:MULTISPECIES: DeoR/GlpR family DNA-binding transcription regulator [Petrotoga]PNR98410.1 hypothetical protein X927_08965 [Petrotoga mexicana DSM 14811]POZ92353.1 hypothetical protein AA81_07740 [Petrotoga halophila DSM 16923]